MPPYLSSYGVSEEIEKIIEGELNTILYSALRRVRSEEDSTIDHWTTLLGTFMNSALHVASQKNNVRYTADLISNMKCMRDCADVCSTIGDFAHHRVRTGLLQVGVSPRETDTRHLHISLYPGDLGLPDKTYYTDKSAPMVRTMEAYVRMLSRVGVHFGVESLEKIIRFEYEAAHILKAAEDEREEFLSGAALERRYKHICWEKFAATGLGGMTHDRFRKTDFIIGSTRWLAALDKWCAKLTVEEWRLWFTAQVILYNLPYLPPPYDDMHYEFFGRRLRDQSEKLPQKQLALYAAQTWLAGPLGKLYIKHYTDPETKRVVSGLAEEIAGAAAERMKTNTWLSEKTKSEALRKIRDVAINISTPDPFDVDHLKNVHLSSSEFMKNVYTLGAAEHARDLADAGTTLKRTQWNEGVFMVNAFYYPEGNRLVMPAGILRPPFYCGPNHGYTYGAIGTTIGHELTHAFDVEGKDYDADGNYRPWWTASDNAHYKKITRDLVKLYERQTYFGKALDGDLTLSENIADIGGMAFSLDALKKKMDALGYSDAKKDSMLREFFIGYAVGWRTKERKEKALQGLFMDSHAPPISRVNNVVSQFDDWIRLFDVKPGDPLYVDPQDRIRIF
jgi:predicted metalloendopeptidase